MLRNTRIPIADVTIKIESLLDDSSFTTVTDENGRFAVEDVHFGLNKVVFTKKNYDLLTKYADIRNGRTLVLDVEMKEDARSIMIYDTVQVLDAQTRLPIQYATIDMYMKQKFDPRKTEEDQVGVYWDFYNNRFTDEAGRASFFIGSLRKKEYLDLEVRIVAAGYQNKVDHFSVYYEERQPLQVILLEPLR